MQRICTVVIATRNRPTKLEECLVALASQVSAVPFGVLVVDNAPENDAAAEIAARHHAGYLIEPHLGLSYARNSGVAACDSDFIAFLDDDSIPEEDWLANLLKPFENPTVMAVTGRIRVFYEEDGRRVIANTHHFDVGPESSVIRRDHKNWFALANFHGSGSGGNMAFRRGFFHQFKGFDERLGRGTGLQAFEESHAFFRLLEAGHSLVYVADAVVHHPDSDRLPGTYPSKTSYMALLCVEHPKYCLKVIRYMFQRFRQIETSGLHPRGNPLLWWFAGPFQYLAMRVRMGAWRGPAQHRVAPSPPKTAVKPAGKTSSVRESS